MFMFINVCLCQLVSSWVKQFSADVNYKKNICEEKYLTKQSFILKSSVQIANARDNTEHAALCSSLISQSCWSLSHNISASNGSRNLSETSGDAHPKDGGEVRQLRDIKI